MLPSFFLPAFASVEHGASEGRYEKRSRLSVTILFFEPHLFNFYGESGESGGTTMPMRGWPKNTFHRLVSDHLFIVCALCVVL
mmetsp:Transcript_41335/g.107018  ORF Transcript_41335/g.107018 Transcript_41335/m.107018 type:complete len:83 (-) Transcript_41335:2209-2457(-)